MKTSSRGRRTQKGHAMMELAIVAGVMVSFLVGTFQFGYAFYVYNQLVTAVGNGARYAAQRTYRAATPDDIERGKAAIRNMVVFGDAQPAAGAVPVISGLSTDQVKVDWVGEDGKQPDAVDISIHDFTAAAIFKPLTFDGKPFAEFPYVGRYAPAEREP